VAEGTRASGTARLGGADRAQHACVLVAAATARGGAGQPGRGGLPASPPAASRLAASHPASGHPASARPANGPSVQLAAWTLTRQADGNIKITFRETADAAELQRTLRADGVPASVTFTGQQNPACLPYTSSGPALEPFGTATGPLNGYSFIQHPQNAFNSPYALVIDPSALPSEAGLQIWTSGTPGAADNFQLQVMLVQASPQCTGS
jgi:hypothetical protein